MLRVGLTGELGSGKSTVARLLAERGAIILSSDEMARSMMQPGTSVFAAIVRHFGPEILLPDGSLNRRELARLAFDPRHPRVEELNGLVHPPVLAEQERRLTGIARDQPDAIVVIESALLFTTNHAGDQPWARRFDQIVVVTAPDETKLARFIHRVAAGQTLTEAETATLRADGQQRIAAQRLSPDAVAHCLQLKNDRGIEDLQRETDALWNRLRAIAGQLGSRP